MGGGGGGAVEGGVDVRPWPCGAATWLLGYVNMLKNVNVESSTRVGVATNQSFTHHILFFYIFGVRIRHSAGRNAGCATDG